MRENIILLLCEGNVDLTFYILLLQKVFKGIEIRRIPDNIRAILGVLRVAGFGLRRMRIIRIGGNLIVVINCNGYESMKRLLRDLFKRYIDLKRMVDKGLKTLIVAADLDKNVASTLRGLLESIRGILQEHQISLSIRELENSFTVLIDGRELRIYYVEQGLPNGSQELEDILELITRQKFTREAEIVEKIECLYHRLSSKEKIGVYEALLVENSGVERLINLIFKVSKLEEVKVKVRGIIKVLSSIIQNRV